MSISGPTGEPGPPPAPPSVPPYGPPSSQQPYPPSWPAQPPPPKQGWSATTIVLVVLGALLLVPLLVVAAVYLFGHYVVSDGPARDDSGQVLERTEAASTDIEVGDCVNDDQMAGLDSGDTTQQASLTVELIPCADPHQFEAYVVEDLSGTDYPGDDAVLQQTRKRCLTAFKEYVGVEVRRSRLDVAYYYPVEEAWPQDREIVCLVSERDLATTGTLKGSRK